MSRNILVKDAESPSEALVEEQEAQNSEEETAEVEAPEAEIPEKYRGKTLEEVIAMHQNAEKEIGRQANEVGTYRELVASLTEAKRAEDLSQADTTEKPVEVTSDDLFDNPTEAIKRIVEDTVTKAITPVQEYQQKAVLNEEIQQLLTEHPDAEQIGAEPEFTDFIEKSPYRMEDARRWVESKDVDAARRLLTDYKDYRALRINKSNDDVKTETDQDPAIERARKVATESGRNSSSAKGKKTLSKREVIKVFNTDRDRYDSPEFQRMLVEHARNGTLVN